MTQHRTCKPEPPHPGRGRQPAIHADFRKILCPDNAGDTDAEKTGSGAVRRGPTRRPDDAVFELDSAYQGQEGLAMVKQALAENRPYALAFVDVRMPPGWDGVETIARIWEVYPELQIVVCTAYSDYSWEEMRAKVGQPDNLLVLKKPFDNVEVQQLAHALTKKWLLNLQAGYKLAELEAMVTGGRRNWRGQRIAGRHRGAVFQGLSSESHSQRHPDPARSAFRGCE